jgi:hypothetical protein
VQVGDVIKGITTVTVTNDWQRVDVSGVISTGLLRFTICTEESVYIWGGQSEQQPFTSSYIRTEGAAVSRSTDSLSLSPYSALSFLDATIDVTFDDSSNEALYPNIYGYGGIGGSIRLFRATGDSLYSSFGNSSIQSSYSSGQQLRVTSTIDAETHSIYRGGVFSASTATVYPTPAFDPTKVLYLGNAATSSAQSINGHILKFSTYDQVLTQQEITLL